jgi:hypothetical protein
LDWGTTRKSCVLMESGQKSQRKMVGLEILLVALLILIS